MKRCVLTLLVSITPDAHACESSSVEVRALGVYSDGEHQYLLRGVTAAGSEQNGCIELSVFAFDPRGKQVGELTVRPDRQSRAPGMEVAIVGNKALQTRWKSWRGKLETALARPLDRCPEKLVLEGVTPRAQTPALAKTKPLQLEQMEGSTCNDAKQCATYGKKEEIAAYLGDKQLLMRTTERDLERDWSTAFCQHTLSTEELIFLPRAEPTPPSTKLCKNNEASQLTAQATKDLEEEADGVARARLERAVARENNCWEAHRQLARALGMESDLKMSDEVLTAHRLRPSETLSWLRNDGKAAEQFRRSSPSEATRLLGK